MTKKSAEAETSALPEADAPVHDDTPPSRGGAFLRDPVTGALTPKPPAAPEAGDATTEESV